jgi:hypothetical protein
MITVIAASKGRQNSEETSLGGYCTNEIIREVAVEREKTDTNHNGAILQRQLQRVGDIRNIYAGA